MLCSHTLRTVKSTLCALCPPRCMRCAPPCAHCAPCCARHDLTLCVLYPPAVQLLREGMRSHTPCPWQLLRAAQRASLSRWAAEQKSIFSGLANVRTMSTTAGCIILRLLKSPAHSAIHLAPSMPSLLSPTPYHNPHHCCPLPTRLTPPMHHFLHTSHAHLTTASTPNPYRTLLPSGRG